MGLKRAGFSLMASVEIDKHASHTHSLNFPECQHLQQDIRLIDWKPFKGKVDLVAGGPPPASLSPSVENSKAWRMSVTWCLSSFVR